VIEADSDQTCSVIRTVALFLKASWIWNGYPAFDNYHNLFRGDLYTKLPNH